MHKSAPAKKLPEALLYQKDNKSFAWVQLSKLTLSMYHFMSKEELAELAAHTIEWDKTERARAPSEV